MDAPLEEYAVSVGLTYVDAELLRDARTHSSRHAISCRPSPADPEAEAQAPDEVQGRALGRRFQLLDCVAHPVAGDPELVDLTLQLRATEPAPPSFEWKIQGPGGKGWTRTFVFPPKGDALSEVETREVTVRVPASPDPTRGRLTLTASVPPLRPGGVRAALFEKGEAGIRFPGHWLVRADAWRWWLKDW